MFRKILTFFLVFLLLGSFAACGKQAQPEASVPETTAGHGITTDEKLLTVDITLPALFFENQKDFDPSTYAQENNYISAKKNDDGSVTVTMSKQRHATLLEDTAKQLEDSFAELIGGADTSYIKDIQYNKDFTEIIMLVDKAAYEKAFDLTPLGMAISSAMYQSLLEQEFSLLVKIVDEATGEIIKTQSYPVEK